MFTVTKPYILNGYSLVSGACSEGGELKVRLYCLFHSCN